MGLIKNMQTDQISGLAIREAVTIGPETVVRDCVKRLRTAGLGCAIVVNGDNKPIGTFTEAMLRHMLIESPGDLDEPVEKVMARVFPWVNKTDTVDLLLDALELKNTRFVVVVDDDGTVCGLTGQKGLMEYVAEYFPGEVMVQRIGTKPYPSSREGA